MRARLLAPLLLALVAAAASPAAQPGPRDSTSPGPPLRGSVAAFPDAPDAVPELSDASEVSLLTMLPGDEVYSLFGHSAFRITDPALGLDRAYNYGTFDFNQPHFVLRFVRGELDYVLDTAPTAVEVERYRAMGRPVIEQRLDVPLEARRALFRLLEVNARPENRAYRYDFFFDNCSTRLLDVLDAALALTGRPAVALPPTPPATYRGLLQPYLVGVPLTRFGIGLGLGLPADAPADAQGRTFLPLELMDLFDRTTVEGRPLVTARDTVFWLPGAGLPAPAFPWPLALTGLLLAVGLAATARVWPTADPARGRAGDALLLGVAGLAGLILLFLWLGTAHGVTGPNLNLLWAWPTHALAAVLVARGRPSRGLRLYLGAAGAATALVALVWPLLPQALPAAAWPLAALLAVRLLARARAMGGSARSTGTRPASKTRVREAAPAGSPAPERR